MMGKGGGIPRLAGMGSGPTPKASPASATAGAWRNAVRYGDPPRPWRYDPQQDPFERRMDEIEFEMMMREFMDLSQRQIRERGA